MGQGHHKRVAVKGLHSRRRFYHRNMHGVQLPLFLASRTWRNKGFLCTNVN
jgi:hypothetical protein